MGAESRPLTAVVLAGGTGARMRSGIPKALHSLCGRPMLLYALEAVQACRPERVVVVVGSGSEDVAKTVQEEGLGHLVTFVEQQVPRGTADAVGVALTATDESLLEDADVLVVPGDAPLLSADDLVELVAEHRAGTAAATLLTTESAGTAGYGRVVREGRDRSVRRLSHPHEELEPADEAEPSEIATGVAVYRRGLLAPALRRVLPDQLLGELHLSDVVEVLTSTGHTVATLPASDAGSVRGVNDQLDLAEVEAELRRRTNVAWMKRGVRMIDPARTYVDTTVVIGRDVILQPGTMLQGRTVVGDGAEIGPDSQLVDCAVGSRAVVTKTMARDAEIGPGAFVGPFAVLRPGVAVAPGEVTGPFYAGPESGSRTS